MAERYRAGILLLASALRACFKPAGGHAAQAKSGRLLWTMITGEFDPIIAVAKYNLSPGDKDELLP
ncbi:hypothetical protein A8C75_22195 [Marinobacterium aestuarii]|uniref:Uncharacterized protein n=1 Tax=Marinobacterium aestuarii TaxID=1821621 RepID=A0A1A9F4Z2_9GAMM|nr:hypothetical protein [Marinobacterium aestuarii]ANG64921.1 hypothetical protein A8C75_22195 [Marinobacterium aestuarii]